jgi:hypothetical protein
VAQPVRVSLCCSQSFSCSTRLPAPCSLLRFACLAEIVFMSFCFFSGPFMVVSSYPHSFEVQCSRILTENVPPLASSICSSSTFVGGDGRHRCNPLCCNLSSLSLSFSRRRCTLVVFVPLKVLSPLEMFVPEKGHLCLKGRGR